MSASISLADVATRDDLRVFLQRIDRSGEPEVRVITRGRALAVYGCTQAPRGITDTVPVVLVMRAFALAEEVETAVDETVLVRGLLDRIARLGITGRTFALPDVSALAAWVGVLPPVSGWQALTTVEPQSISRVATEGISRVASALPDQPGDAVVARVRREVWGPEIAPGLPAAAAFAAETMGFVSDAPFRMSASQTWTRLSSERGHVLVRILSRTPVG